MRARRKTQRILVHRVVRQDLVKANITTIRRDRVVDIDDVRRHINALRCPRTTRHQIARITQRNCTTRRMQRRRHITRIAARYARITTRRQRINRRLKRTRIIDIKDKRLVNFQGTYDEYLASQEATERLASAS